MPGKDMVIQSGCISVSLKSFQSSINYTSESLYFTPHIIQMYPVRFFFNQIKHTETNLWIVGMFFNKEMN